jgi:hypothetical protein
MIGALFGIAGAAVAYGGANKAQKKAEQDANKAQREMDRLKGVYANLDTSNPYLNMENKMEDLTVNQGQAQFEQQMAQQSQANILDSMRGAAGGSGIAATAQALAQQGQLAAQRASVSIGQQESANQMAERQAASQIQQQERQGEVLSRQQELNKQSTLLGMSQAETAAAREREAGAQQAKTDALAGGLSSLGGFFGVG